MQQEANTFFPANRQQWRDWLAKHHDAKPSVWLIYAKKKAAGVLALTYDEAVEEALCFGWIDSTTRPIDADTFMQFFCPRKPKSGWSKVNKERIDRLIAADQMKSAGIACIERAKQNGSWLLLDDIEALIVPTDMEEALQKKTRASTYFHGLCRSDKRAILLWLAAAKRLETRQNRIADVVNATDRQMKPAIIRRR
jgi:uncharacterized protein YdeI (YjbR/CyaY-like superfamily)